MSAIAVDDKAAGRTRAQAISRDILDYARQVHGTGDDSGLTYVVIVLDAKSPHVQDAQSAELAQSCAGRPEHIRSAILGSAQMAARGSIGEPETPSGHVASNRPDRQPEQGIRNMEDTRKTETLPDGRSRYTNFSPDGDTTRAVKISGDVLKEIAEKHGVPADGSSDVSIVIIARDGAIAIAADGSPLTIKLALAYQMGLMKRQFPDPRKAARDAQIAELAKILMEGLGGPKGEDATPKAAEPPLRDIED